MCLSPKPTIKGEIHEHPFILFWRQVPFICDACGTSGDCVSYICSPCGLIVHEKCISLQPFIKRFPRHSHPISHTFFLGKHEIETGKCRICSEEVNSNHGCYCCSGCNYLVHANCAKKDYSLLTKTVSDNPACQGHEHILTFYDEYEGQCNGCVNELVVAFACKECNFSVRYRCLRLPNKILHKCDEHPLMLTYHEDNSYSKYHYCDVCETKRNPSQWFYHCAICDNSVHRKCAIDKYSFMKIGKTYTATEHPHPLTFVRKVFDYPECHGCHRHCEDLSVECLQNGCNYIVHWKCIDPLIYLPGPSI
ncbi:uncharacterized protein LOC120213428 [Hibiscus syriacus]|uniref:uncharacterized protein LOC120213428 n=1 Tax=Hibiscus syriacus TaxID=106335 RepID=UPI001923E3BE|nr:uncharacterized protein LOC120213428 [Hibiscus syriacus]